MAKKTPAAFELGRRGSEIHTKHWTPKQRSEIASEAVAAREAKQKPKRRSARRWGDWFILDVPTPLLWFDEASRGRFRLTKTISIRVQVAKLGDD